MELLPEPGCEWDYVDPKETKAQVAEFTESGDVEMAAIYRKRVGRPWAIWKLDVPVYGLYTTDEYNSFAADQERRPVRLLLSEARASGKPPYVRWWFRQRFYEVKTMTPMEAALSDEDQAALVFASCAALRKRVETAAAAMARQPAS